MALSARVKLYPYGPLVVGTTSKHVSLGTSALRAGPSRMEENITGEGTWSSERESQQDG